MKKINESLHSNIGIVERTIRKMKAGFSEAAFQFSLQRSRLEQASAN